MRSKYFQFHIFLCKTLIAEINSKGATSLKKIWLHRNNLSALHPKMFSNLANLERLFLHDNICVSKNFLPVTSMEAIEQELAECGVGYALHEQQNSE
jgi:hypothetical protein